MTAEELKSQISSAGKLSELTARGKALAGPQINKLIDAGLAKGLGAAVIKYPKLESIIGSGAAAGSASAVNKLVEKGKALAGPKLSAMTDKLALSAAAAAAGKYPKVGSLLGVNAAEGSAKVVNDASARGKTSAGDLSQNASLSSVPSLDTVSATKQTTQPSSDLQGINAPAGSATTVNNAAVTGKAGVDEAAKDRTSALGALMDKAASSTDGMTIKKVVNPFYSTPIESLSKGG